jgi:hypothetical protein
LITSIYERVFLAGLCIEGVLVDIVGNLSPLVFALATGSQDR